MLRDLAKAVIWPLRRFFDPRFAGVDDHVGIAHRELDENLADLRATELAAIRDELAALRRTLEESRDAQAVMLRDARDQTADATAVLGQSIAELRAELDELARTVERLGAQPADQT